MRTNGRDILTTRAAGWDSDLILFGVSTRDSAAAVAAITGAERTLLIVCPAVPAAGPDSVRLIGRRGGGGGNKFHTAVCLSNRVRTISGADADNCIQRGDVRRRR